MTHPKRDMPAPGSGARARMRFRAASAALACAALSAACDETLPTSTDPGLIPVTPVTVEVQLPFSDWGSNVRVQGGFGRVADLSGNTVALDFEDAVDARALVRFARYPASVQVANQSGVVVNDEDFTVVGGRVVAIVDTIGTVAPGPVQIEASALVENWDQNSASWTYAVDTVGARVAWSEPGAGPVTAVDVTEWNPELGDTIVLNVDSTTVNAWADTTDGGRGLRLASLTSGTRVDFVSIQLDIDIRPSVNPDTLVQRTVFGLDNLFVYDPPPAAPAGELRVGGAPAWRSTFRIQLPDSLDGPPELCEAAGCPFAITAESVNFARLVLTSAPSPPGFQPDDTLALDVRAVLNEATLPKSPIGPSLLGLFGARAPPDFFREGGDGQITVTITEFVQDLVRGTNRAGDPAPASLALLTVFEPLSVELLTFRGPGDPKEPVLSLILTTRVGIPLR